MTLAGTDLNLLLPLKVLLEERNVTRAGQRLEVGQPTMSATLARLRRRFDDELLVRSGRGYDLTPFARAMLPEVQRAVHLLAVALDAEEPFEAADSRRVFRVATFDHAESLLNQTLVPLLRDQAPGVRLTIEHLDLGGGSVSRVLHDVDAVVAPLGTGLPGVPSRRLWADRLVVLADRDNRSLTGAALSMQDFRAASHAVADLGPGVATPDERLLGEAGIERDVVVRAPGYLALPLIVEGTDLLTLVPEMLAVRCTGENSRLIPVEPPFGPLTLVHGCWSAQSRASDPAHRWFLDRLAEASALISAVRPG